MRSLKHVAAAFMANAVTAGAQYLLVVLVARQLGPQAFGGFFFALTLGTLVAVLPNFGLDRVLLRQIVRTRSDSSAWVSSAAALRAALAGLALAIAAMVSPWVAPAGLSPLALFLIVVSLVVALFAEMCRSALYASNAMAAEAGLRAIGRLLTLGAAVAAVVWGGTLTHLGAALAFAAMVETAIYVRYTRRALQLTWQRPSRTMARSLAVDALPIAFNTLFVLLYFRVNLLMVTAWAGAGAAGQFGAAFTFLQVLQVASGSLAGVVLPHFLQMVHDGDAALAARVQLVTQLLVLGIVPVAASIALLAPEIVTLVYSARYAAAVPALTVLVWAAVFMFLGSLHGTLLIVLHAERSLFWLSLAAAAVSLTANAILIPLLGLVGASWSTVLTEALVGLSCLALVRKRLGVPTLRSLLLPAAAAAAIAGLLAAGPDLSLVVRAALAGTLVAAAGAALAAASRPLWQPAWHMRRARGSASA